MSLFISKIKGFGWLIAFLIIVVLGAMLGYKSRKINRLQDELLEKLREIATYQETLKEERKKATFESDDIKQNLEVVKDFEAIDTQIQEEAKSEKNPTDSDNDSFSFRA